jgi:hypothetical protein
MELCGEYTMKLHRTRDEVGKAYSLSVVHRGRD